MDCVDVWNRKYPAEIQYTVLLMQRYLYLSWLGMYKEVLHYSLLDWAKVCGLTQTCKGIAR